jgi:hypothetical protein
MFQGADQALKSMSKLTLEIFTQAPAHENRATPFGIIQWNI